MKNLTLTLTAPSPRNPLALAARLRRAGSHRNSNKALRQQQRMQLRGALMRPGFDPGT
ncbi:hypothetical protein [Ideonella sp.]|uniref:hypothetical protein n=1 Tax=Ideonella sp. TaxID=1929293 RepID=UPI003BB72F07